MPAGYAPVLSAADTAEPSNVVDVENASKAILSTVAAVTVLVGGCARPPSTSAPAGEKPAAVRFAEGLRGRISTEAMMAHLSKLQEIADANNGTRAVGTPGYEASVDYVAKTLGQWFRCANPAVFRPSV